MGRLGGTPNTSLGGRYNPSTDTWTKISSLNAPTPRAYHNAVWTGTEMIVWGGDNGLGRVFTGKLAGVLNDGARYNPGSDSWSPISNSNAPTSREGATAVWTGTEMIVWGG